MPLPLTTPLPRPPTTPDSVPMSKPLRDWVGSAISDWDANLVRTIDANTTAQNNAINALMDSMLFEQSLVGAADGVNKEFSFPQRIRTTPLGVAQGMLYVGTTHVMGSDWSLVTVSGSTQYPNGQKIMMVTAPTTVPHFAFVLVVT